MEGTKDIESQDALKEIRQEYNAVRVRTDGSVLEHFTSLSLLRISAYSYSALVRLSQSRASY